MRTATNVKCQPAYKCLSTSETQCIYTHMHTIFYVWMPKPMSFGFLIKKGSATLKKKEKKNRKKKEKGFTLHFSCVPSQPSQPSQIVRLYNRVVLNAHKPNTLKVFAFMLILFCFYWIDKITTTKQQKQQQYKQQYKQQYQQQQERRQWRQLWHCDSATATAKLTTAAVVLLVVVVMVMLLLLLLVTSVLAVGVGVAVLPVTWQPINHTCTLCGTKSHKTTHTHIHIYKYMYVIICVGGACMCVGVRIFSNKWMNEWIFQIECVLFASNIGRVALWKRWERGNCNNNNGNIEAKCRNNFVAHIVCLYILLVYLYQYVCVYTKWKSAACKYLHIYVYVCICMCMVDHRCLCLYAPCIYIYIYYSVSIVAYIQVYLYKDSHIFIYICGYIVSICCFEIYVCIG